MPRVVVVVGQGGREYYVVKQLLREDENVDRIICAPGNPGMVNLDPTRVELRNYATLDELRDIAVVERADLVIVGPEKALVDGLGDKCRQKGIPFFGPSRDAAALEGSKGYCRQTLANYKIPSPKYQVFTKPDAAKQVLESSWRDLVVKANGLCGGKGVVVPTSQAQALAAIDTIMVEKKYGDAGSAVIHEERLFGTEISVQAICDGRTVIPLFPARDYKPVGDGDTGDNTGGMGSIAPSPTCPQHLRDMILQTILIPIVNAMQKEGHPFIGVLYVGIMLTNEGPKVLEINCRFGDPETQAVLGLLTSPLYPLLKSASEGNLHTLPAHHWPQWSNDKAVYLVLCSPGYPGDFAKDLVIEGIEAAEDCGVEVIHAGTKADGGVLKTNGGRVLGLRAQHSTIENARMRVMAAARHITFGGKPAQYRTDIGVGIV